MEGTRLLWASASCSVKEGWQAQCCFSAGLGAGPGPRMFRQLQATGTRGQHEDAPGGTGPGLSLPPHGSFHSSPLPMPFQDPTFNTVNRLAVPLPSAWPHVCPSSMESFPSFAILFSMDPYVRFLSSSKKFPTICFLLLLSLLTRGFHTCRPVYLRTESSPYCLLRKCLLLLVFGLPTPPHPPVEENS